MRKSLLNQSRGLAAGVVALAGIGAATTALACTCLWGGAFSVVARNAPVILHGTVMAHESYGMVVAVETVLRGDETREVVRVWGDSGALCRPYVSRFPVGTEWVLALQRGLRQSGEEQAGDYAISVCGEYGLRVTGDTVYLGERAARVSLAALSAEIRAWQGQPPPDLSNLRGMLPANIMSPVLTPAPSAGSDDGTASSAAAAVVPAVRTTRELDAQTCAAIKLGGFAPVEIEVAELLAAGALSPPPAAAAATLVAATTSMSATSSAGAAPLATTATATASEIESAYRALPALCRILGTLSPGRAAEASFELWIPALGWTGAHTTAIRDSVLDGAAIPFTETTEPMALRRGVALFALGRSSSRRPSNEALRLGERLVEDVARFVVDRKQRLAAGMFPYNETWPTVTEGPGRIEGRVTRGDRPVAGFALRLRVGTSAWSVWTATDGAGRYSVAVPYGAYTIGGYQLSAPADDRALQGALLHPSDVSVDVAVAVSPGSAGQGPDVRFVDPIVLRAPRGDVTASQARWVVWDAHTGAARYRVELTVASSVDPSGTLRAGSVRRFDVPGASLDLDAIGVTLSPGSYTLAIHALDETGAVISRTVRAAAEVGFRVIE